MKSISLAKPSSNGFSNLHYPSMQTERVDQVSSLLLSLILLVGLSVIVLGVLFSIGEAIQEKSKIPPPTTIGVGQRVEGKSLEQGLDVPIREEVEQLNEPTADQAISLVTEVVSKIAGSFESIESETNASSSGVGEYRKRYPGVEGKGSGGTPRNERWTLKFTARDKRNYARQLESFQIKIGAIGGGIVTVDTLSNVASAPIVKSGASQDFRGILYFMSTNANVLEQYEKQMLQAAGVPIVGRQILKFIPDETEELLALAEANFYMENRSKDLKIAEIVKTVFECRLKKDGVGYEFVVVDQRYGAY